MMRTKPVLTGDVHSLGTVPGVYTSQVLDTLAAVVATAKRLYKIDNVAELSPKRREKFKAEVDDALKILGIKGILIEWKEAREDEHVS